MTSHRTFDADQNAVDAEFKVMVISGCQSGKTAFCKRDLVGEFEKRWLPSSNTDIHPIVLETNFGRIRLNVWDNYNGRTQDDPSTCPLGARHARHLYAKTEAVIVMFDPTDTCSGPRRTDTCYGFARLERWLQNDAMPFCSGSCVPTCLVESKIDSLGAADNGRGERRARPSRVSTARIDRFRRQLQERNGGRWPVPFCGMSALSGQNWSTPYLEIVRLLCGEPGMVLTEAWCALAPAELPQRHELTL
eukprot:SAG22_NODE_1983_length_3206_cov_3.243000_1_plen_247_part_10